MIEYVKLEDRDFEIFAVLEVPRYMRLFTELILLWARVIVRGIIDNGKATRLYRAFASGLACSYVSQRRWIVAGSAVSTTDSCGNTTEGMDSRRRERV